MINRAEFEVRLNDRVSGAARKAAGAVDQLNDKFRKHNKISGRQSRRAQDRDIFHQREMTGTIKAGLLGGIDVYGPIRDAATAVARLTKSLALATYESATFAQSQEMAFTQLAKHGVDGRRLFEHVRKSAQDLGLDVKDTTKQYTKFLALQFTPKEADNLVKMGADLQALGNDAESVKGIFVALGQIKSKDKLQAEELLQLSERGISSALVQEEIGKIMGKTREEVRKLQEQGKVDGTTAILGIEKAINRKLGQSELGETGKKFAQTTLAGISGQLKGNWDNLWIGLGQRVDDRMTDVAGRLLGRFQNWVDSGDAAKFMDDIAGGIDRVVTGFDNVVGKIGPFTDGLKSGAESAGPIADLFDAFGDKKSDLAEVANDTERFARSIGFAYRMTSSLLGLGARVADDFIAPIVRLPGRFVETWDRVRAMASVESWGMAAKAEQIGREWISGIWGGISGALMNIFWPGTAKTKDEIVAQWSKLDVDFSRLGGNLMKGLADGIALAVPLPVRAMIDAAKRVVGAAEGPKALDVHSPSRRTFWTGEQTMYGMAGGIDARARVATRAAFSAGAGVAASFSAGLGGAPSPSLGGRPSAAFGPRAQLPAFEPATMMGGSGGRGGASLSGPLVRIERIEVNGAGADGESIGESIVAHLEPHLESLFGRWAEAVGA